MFDRYQEMQTCQKWIQEACAVLEVPCALAMGYLQCFSSEDLGFPSLSPAVSSPAVVFLASRALNWDLCFDIDCLSLMTDYSVSTESIGNAVSVMLPYAQQFPHPSMFYCQLFSNWLYDNGICTHTQSKQLSQKCLKTINTINFEALSQLPPLELSWYLIKGYCDNMVIPEATKCMSENLGFEPCNVENVVLCLFVQNLIV
ncbi:hypothetical protein GEMRC1_000416 [Eukaryota sp. GEM-RC1]